MLDGLPTDWTKDLWDAAQKAGTFGAMLELVIIVWVCRWLRRERRLNEAYAERLFTLAESTKHVLENNNGLLDKNNETIGKVKDAIIYQFSPRSARRRAARKRQRRVA